MEQYVKVAKVTEIPDGASKLVELDDKQIGIFNIGGKYYAINNVCPHRGGPLHEGNLEGTIITCPWHGWQFDVCSGASPVNPALQQSCYPVKVEGGTISIIVQATAH
jgi:nitrite reductase (NADH) small subunit